ncbi:MAG: hypothetical protein DRJ47_04015 [Thermoprotei archaeon]|nr:MAG: hypothetical protein DRJ47_04015 [Thermoprotei archaeon]
MKRIYILFLVLALAVLLTAPLYKATPPKYYYIYVKVKASADLKAGYPVVIKVGDLKKMLTKSFSWENVYVLHGDEIIPAQVDKLGESEDDYEIVFLLSSDIPAGGEDTYKILVAEAGYKLPKPSFEETCKVSFVSMYLEKSDLGPAVILENDLIKAVILNESDWIAGTVFSAQIKASGYDVVKQGREVDSTGWRWSRYLVEGDPGWAEKNPDFNILYVSSGPVRAVVVLQSTESHGSVENVYAVKKYSVYKGLSVVELVLTVTGTGYKEGTAIPIKASFVDMGSQGLEHDTVYIPNLGEFSRNEGKGFRKENFTQSWFAVYNKSEMKGFGAIFYPLDDLVKFDWGSPGDELALKYTTGVPIPFYRVLVLFDKTITTEPLEYIGALYNLYANKPTIEVEEVKEAKLLPATILETYAKEISSLKSQVESLQNTVSEQESTISQLETQLSNAQNTINQLNNQVSNLQAQISDLEGELAAARSMQWTFLGGGLVVGLIIGIVIGFIVKRKK